ncbi:MAG: DUF6773 family protein [Faecousia sp.]
MKKSNLDEMQEQALLKIEHYGCWLAFWGLLAVMAIQALLGVAFSSLLGEWIVFMVLCAYIVVSCLRHGIWDRYLKPNLKTNLLASILAGLAVGVFSMLLFHANETEFLDYLLIGAISTILVFVLCFLALTVFTALYKKRREKLDQE